MTDGNVGKRIGIYDVLYECDEKRNDGHKLYHVRCVFCGWETDMQLSDVKRADKCTHYNKLTQEQKDTWYEKNKKQCLYCGEYIPFNNRCVSEYKIKNFCSQSCSTSYNNKGVRRNYKKDRNYDIKKYCLNCGKEIEYRNKYCSSKCQQDYQYKQYITRWKSGLESGTKGEYQISGYIKKYLFDKYENKCAKCGWHEINEFTGNIPLEVHHKNGDYTDNTENNLELLCPNCHSLTKTYKAGNMGNGRKERKKYNV